MLDEVWKVLTEEEINVGSLGWGRTSGQNRDYNKKLKCNLAKIIGTLFAKFITGR